MTSLVLAQRRGVKALLTLVLPQGQEKCTTPAPKLLFRSGASHR